jgi:hypothetical protein
MIINTQLSEKLEVINSLYQKGYYSELIERSLSKIIELERSQAIKQASELQEKLQKYEAKYQRTSDDFYQQFMAGELGDSIDFTEWSIFYDMWQSVQSRLSVLQPLEN